MQLFRFKKVLACSISPAMLMFQALSVNTSTPYSPCFQVKHQLTKVRSWAQASLVQLRLKVSGSGAFAFAISVCVATTGLDSSSTCVGDLGPQVSDRAELEVHMAVLEGAQLKTARIGKPDPLTWLPPPPLQVSDRAEDEEPIWKCAKRGQVSCIHLAVLECPQLKTAANEKRDPLT